MWMTWPLVTMVTSLPSLLRLHRPKFIPVSLRYEWVLDTQSAWLGEGSLNVPHSAPSVSRDEANAKVLQVDRSDPESPAGKLGYLL